MKQKIQILNQHIVHLLLRTFYFIQTFWNLINTINLISFENYFFPVLDYLFLILKSIIYKCILFNSALVPLIKKYHTT